MTRTRPARLILTLFLSWCLLQAAPAYSQVKKALTFEDVMKFRAIKDPVISEDGRWIAYAADPDRGDGQLYVRSTAGQPVYTLDRGSKPVISKNSRWVAALVKPSFLESEKAKAAKSKEPEPKGGMALLDTQSGQWKKYDRVDRFAFSEDSAWISILHSREEKKEPTPGTGKEQPRSPAKDQTGSLLQLVALSPGQNYEIPWVTFFEFSPDAHFLAYSVQRPERKGNGIYCRDLSANAAQEAALVQAEGGRYSNLTWSKEGGLLTFLAASGSDEEDTSVSCSLQIWSSGSKEVKTAVAQSTSGWFLPLKNDVIWSKDGKRIFFGRKPVAAATETEEASLEKEPSDIYSIPEILKRREGDIWHWNDPRIITQQKVLWPRTKERTYRAVYHLDSGTVTALADESLPDVARTENPKRALGLSDVPYLKEITWDGNYSDVYVVDLRDGSRKKVVTRLAGRPSLSPQGKYVVYYRDGDWHIFDCENGTTRNLTQGLGVSFADEDHDTPDAPPGYGIAGWIGDDASVLIYDKFDIWQFPTSGGQPVNWTQGRGRKEARVFRLIATDKEKESWVPGEAVLLSSYHDRDKNYGFYGGTVGAPGVTRVLEEKKRFQFLHKSKEADAILFTRESYEEFPDLWISDLQFRAPRKLTQVNPQISEFAWGEAELVEWNSADGIPLQGVLIKPGNFEAGKRFPVLVYYYELSAQRLYEFNQPVVNHRPCFALYASDGYAIFLPDIRFEIGQPGFSATKCLVPGVQKLIDMGIADPKGIGLHGHSWSGYQTAFVITQTHLFSAAIAGAPVSNMTSAYSGIRWESGLARQFQYEKSQSRIGKTLWEAPQQYIENSPVFFADRIRTPLLIQFGDEDGAVPWYQGIELYLAMRRLGKDCIFLQYHGEPHHLQKYPNKLDYAIKMKEYFDHYLRGMPAAEWISKGETYKGK